MRVLPYYHPDRYTPPSFKGVEYRAARRTGLMCSTRLPDTTRLLWTGALTLFSLHRGTEASEILYIAPVVDPNWAYSGRALL